MKESKYNIFFKEENLQVGFNSFTQEFIAIDADLFELYEVGSRRKDFSEFQEIHPTFYSFLIEKGFLVDQELDEFEKVKKLSRIVDDNDSVFSLTINPTMNCNFKCWYCYESHIKDSKMDEHTISSVSAFIKNIIATQKNLRRFDLSFFGGEPLLYFHKVISKILHFAHSVCQQNNIIFSAGMTTNGLLLDETILSECKRYNLDSFQITLDGNKERHDKVRFISEGKGSYDRIVSNIHRAVQLGLNVNVRINCSQETISGLNEIVDSFTSLHPEEISRLNFNLQKVWQEKVDIDNPLKEFKLLLKSKGFPVSIGGLGSLIDSCYADKRHQATINYNGEAFKCTARDFVNNSGEGKLQSDGSIIWNDKYEKRLNAKFKNRPCLTCQILPLCGGGCSQLALENEGQDYCVFGFDENKKFEHVKSLFQDVLNEA